MSKNEPTSSALCVAPRSPSDWKERKQWTDEIFNDPQPGDELSEMFSYWLFIIARSGDEVTVIEAWGPTDDIVRDFPQRKTTVSELRKKYAYGTMPGYSLTANRRGMDVSWANIADQRRSPE